MADETSVRAARRDAANRQAWGNLRSSSNVGEANNRAVRRRLLERAEKELELGELEKRLRKQGVI